MMSSNLALGYRNISISIPYKSIKNIIVFIQFIKLRHLKMTDYESFKGVSTKRGAPGARNKFEAHSIKI